MKTGLVNGSAVDRQSPGVPTAFHGSRVSTQRSLSLLRHARLAVVCLAIAGAIARGDVPSITQQPQSVSAESGSNVTLSVTVTGDGPMTFQWMVNGTTVPQIITTAAGNGTDGFSGDGGPATSATLYNPIGLAIDTNGGLYIEDSQNHRIRKVSTNGIISTFVGNGTTTFAGDGIAATNTGLSIKNWEPLAIDNSGNLLIPEDGNYRVRRVTPNGIITTIAGNGSFSDAGDGDYATNAGIDPSGLAVGADGTTFIATFLQHVRKVDQNGIITTIAGTGSLGFGGDGGDAMNASFRNPQCLLLDSVGDLYITDHGNALIRRIDTNGIITTVVGSTNSALGDGGPATNASLWSPYGIAFDNGGSLLIVDRNNQRLRSVDIFGTITTVAGTGVLASTGDGGPATSAALSYPNYVAVRSDGTIYVSEDHKVRQISPAANQPVYTLKNIGPAVVGNYTVVVRNAFGAVTSDVATVSLSGPPVILSQPLNQTALIGDDVTMSVSTTGDLPQTYQWSLNGATLPQNGSTISITNAQTTDAGTYKVVVSNSVGSVTSQPAVLQVGTAPVITNQPVSQEVVYPTNATFVGGASGSAPLRYQWLFNGTSMASATNASVVISNVVLTRAGSYQLVVTNVFGSTTSEAATLTIDQAPPAFTSPPSSTTMVYGNASVLTAGAISTIPFTYQWMLNGTLLDGATSSALTVSNLLGALNYSVIAANDYGSVTTAVATVNVQVDESYNFTALAGGASSVTSGDGTNGSASFYDPANICIDTNGNLYVADFWGQVIRQIMRVGTNAIVTTIAGKAQTGGAVDGTNGVARFYNPNGIALDGSGALYVSDWHSGTIRRIVPSGTNWVVSTIATGLLNSFGGVSGPSGLAVDSAGRVFFAEAGRQTVRMVVRTNTSWVVAAVAGLANTRGTGDGTNTTARFNSPDRLAIDGAGNIYVADYGNYCIRKITPMSTNFVVTTFAGSKTPGWNDGPAATARFSNVEGIAFDKHGNLYVADYFTNRLVRKVTPSGLVTTLGRNNGMSSLYGAAADPAGNVFLSDGNGIIWQGNPAIELMPPPAPVSADSISANGFPVTLSLPAIAPSRLQVSMDLVNWFDLTNFPTGGQTVTFQDAFATGNGQRFYRLISP
jgi:sugar lactone lactonase YvrE